MVSNQILWWSEVKRRVPVLWLQKGLVSGVMMAAFFVAYFHAQTYPFRPPVVVAATVADYWVGFDVRFVWLYVSLWGYVLIPSLLADTQREIGRLLSGMGSVVTLGVLVFYIYPTRIPMELFDVSLSHPVYALLRDLDGLGNSCPSLHVATVAYAAYVLHGQLRTIGAPRGLRVANVVWALGIVYSTMAIKQHMWIDVLGGLALAGVCVAGTFWMSGDGQKRFV